jgi:hypothetical protein
MRQPTGEKAFYLRDADGRGLGQVYRALRLLVCDRCERYIDIDKFFMYSRSRATGTLIICETCTGFTLSATPAEIAAAEADYEAWEKEVSKMTPAEQIAKFGEVLL